MLNITMHKQHDKTKQIYLFVQYPV